MGALATRAALVAGGDHYLMPLGAKQTDAITVEAWVEAAVAGEQLLTLIFQERGDQVDLLGAGYTVTRPLTATVDGTPVCWEERVLIIRSQQLADAQWLRMQRRVAQAEEALLALTPPRKRGRKQYRERAALEAAITATLQRCQVQGVLGVTLAEETAGGTPCWVVTTVWRDPVALDAHRQRLGWRVLATSAPDTRLPLDVAVRTYREGWQIEHQFHQMKDHPLGISPLQVRREDQLCGMVRLLTLALRLLTLVTSQVRHGLARDGLTMAGLYPHQASRTTDQPTGVRVLKAIAASEITLNWLTRDGHETRYLTPVAPVVQTVLAYCQLPTTLYTRLADTRSSSG